MQVQQAASTNRAGERALDKSPTGVKHKSGKDRTNILTSLNNKHTLQKQAEEARAHD